MQELALEAATALWLGLLTAISPCPLATNIAAISYIGHRAGQPRYVFWSGLLYTMGRSLGYVLVAMILVGMTLSLPQVSRFLQTYIHLVLGPLLILVGMVLLELIHFNIGELGVSEGLRKRIDSLGMWGGLPLGLLFALSYCPTSAAIYFGSLIPLSISQGSTLLIPTIYGFGTAVPVIVFAFVIAYSVKSLGTTFKMLGKIEKWARLVTGLLFVSLGIWFSLKYVFGLGL